LSLALAANSPIELVVWNDGVTLTRVDAQHTSSLGLQLVNSLARQIGGTVMLSQIGGT